MAYLYHRTWYYMFPEYPLPVCRTMWLTIHSVAFEVPLRFSRFLSGIVYPLYIIWCCCGMFWSFASSDSYHVFESWNPAYHIKNLCSKMHAVISKLIDKNDVLYHPKIEEDKLNVRGSDYFYADHSEWPWVAVHDGEDILFATFQFWQQLEVSMATSPVDHLLWAAVSVSCTLVKIGFSSIQNSPSKLHALHLTSESTGVLITCDRMCQDHLGVWHIMDSVS